VLSRTVHPATDAWLAGQRALRRPPQVRRAADRTDALQTLTAHPKLLHRNPDNLRRAWEIQAEDRADFIALFGSDLMVLPPDEAQEKLWEHYRRRVRKAVADIKGSNFSAPASRLGQRHGRTQQGTARRDVGVGLVGEPAIPRGCVCGRMPRCVSMLICIFTRSTPGLAAKTAIWST
jgi:hypothetical protein